MQQLIIIRGLPGSGKSTIAKSLTGFIHVEADQFFIAKDGEYKFDASKLKDAHAWCMEMAESGLVDGKNVVVSNTFTRRWEFLPYINMAKKHGIAANVIIACGRFNNIHGVPDAVIAQMAARWED